MTNCPKCGVESSVVDGKCLSVDCDYDIRYFDPKEDEFDYTHR